MRALVLLLALLAAPALAEDASVAEDAPRPVVSVIVAPQSALASSWVGSVAAASEIGLGFLSLGTLAERLVSAGDTVTQDEILARLDASDLEAELRASRAGVSIAEAALQTARDADERARSLVERGVGSAVTAENAANNLASARATLEQARAAERRAEDARGHADLKAPIDGVVTEVNAEAGATLNAGETVLTLAALKDREVVIALTEDDAAGMARGTVFDIRLLANPEITATATLDRIDTATTRATRTRSAHLTLASDAAASFRLGALAIATLKGGQDSFITLPASALIADTTSSDVWRVIPGQRIVERITIQTGPRTGGRVVVLSGLSEGDEIVARGVNSMIPGQPVGPRIAAQSLAGADR